MNMHSKHTYFIYKYTFPNGKIYIGQTYKGSRRFGKVSDYAGTLVYRAMKKYPNFKKDIIEYCKEKDVDKREQYWIKFYDSTHRDKGYNRDTGGNLNKHLSEDLKKVLSEKHKGLYAEPVLQYSLKGEFIKEWPSEKAVHDALGIQVNNACTNRQQSAGGFQWKLKKDPRVITDIYNPVQQYDMQGNLVKEWDSIVEINKKLGISKTGIVECCNNKMKSSGGFQWKYKLDNRKIGVYYKEKSSTSFKKGIPSKNKGVGKREVIQYDLKGKIVKVWGGVAIAEHALHIFGVGFSCRSKNNLAGGFQWKYYDDDSKVIGPYKRTPHPLTDAQKEAISKANKGRHREYRPRPEHRGANNPGARAVSQYSLDDKFIKDWDYITLASKTLGINMSCISECLKGKQKTAGGFKWKYK